MGSLPVSTVVDVTITRETIFPTRKGFGTQLIVTAENTGPLNAGNRVKLYRSVDEVAADWPSTAEARKAAETAFSQAPAADELKIGWRDSANPHVDELDLLVAEDDDWYGLAFTNEVRDDAVVDLIAAWVEPRTKLFITCSNDVLTEDETDLTNQAYRLQQLGYDRTGVFYHRDASLYPDAAFLSRALSIDLNNPNSAITMKFKRLPGITPVGLNSAELRAVTGFVPAQGLDDTAGFFANTYISLGGIEMTAEGNMASGEFFDIMHFADWLANAIQLEVFGRLTTVGKVPYTNVGIQNLVDGVELMLLQGVLNGGIASDIDEETGEVIPEFETSVARVEDVPASQRANRIAPDIQFIARLAGAIHYSTITGRLVV